MVCDKGCFQVLTVASRFWCTGWPHSALSHLCAPSDLVSCFAICWCCCSCCSLLYKLYMQPLQLWALCSQSNLLITSYLKLLLLGESSQARCHTLQLIPVWHLAWLISQLLCISHKTSYPKICLCMWSSHFCCFFFFPFDIFFCSFRCWLSVWSEAVVVIQVNVVRHQPLTIIAYSITHHNVAVIPQCRLTLSREYLTHV